MKGWRVCWGAEPLTREGLGYRSTVPTLLIPHHKCGIFYALTDHSERSIGTDGFANYLGEFEIAFTALRGNPGERNAIAVRAYLEGNDSPFSDNVEWTTG